MSIRPDDDPTIADGLVIDGEVIDSTIVDAPSADDEMTARLHALSMEIDDSPAELGEQTTATLHALAAEAGDPPADLHDVVLAGAQRTRRRRYAMTGMTALAVLAISGTVVAQVGRASDQGTDRLVAAAPRSPAPLPTTDSITAPPAATPSRVRPASPAASASIAGIPGIVPAPARPAPAPGTTKPQGPPPAPLSVTIRVSDMSPRVGDDVTFTFEWHDADGRLLGTSADWGNASGGSGDAAMERPCKATGSGTTALTHHWDKAGTYQVTLDLSTYDCTRFGTETISRTVTIVVSDAPSPSPTPTTPSPTDTTPPSGVG
ncbi:MAG: hypothetical protein QOC93_843 [Actinomycetota bacterium]|nr:hypothetical protein [Actinomycetota bacterium]